MIIISLPKNSMSSTAIDLTEGRFTCKFGFLNIVILFYFLSISAGPGCRYLGDAKTRVMNAVQLRTHQDAIQENPVTERKVGDWEFSKAHVAE